MQLHKIEAGNFHVDGGAVFGVVPKKYGKNAIRATKIIIVNYLCVVYSLTRVRNAY